MYREDLVDAAIAHHKLIKEFRKEKDRIIFNHLQKGNYDPVLFSNIHKAYEKMEEKLNNDYIVGRMARVGTN